MQVHGCGSLVFVDPLSPKGKKLKFHLICNLLHSVTDIVQSNLEFCKPGTINRTIICSYILLKVIFSFTRTFIYFIFSQIYFKIALIDIMK